MVKITKTASILALIASLGGVAYANESSFYLLCKSGTADQIKEAVQKGASINRPDHEGGTCLIWAAAFNQSAETVQAILDAGADPLVVDRAGFTALSSSATNRNEQIQHLLVRAESMARKLLADKKIAPSVPPQKSMDDFVSLSLALTKERQKNDHNNKIAIPAPPHESIDDFVNRAVALTKERQQKAQMTEAARQAVEME